VRSVRHNLIVVAAEKELIRRRQLQALDQLVAWKFAAWCDRRPIRELADVQPVHVAAFVKKLQG
jgi:hypothetical protein